MTWRCLPHVLPSGRRQVHNERDAGERDPLALAMLAAWVNVPIDKLPETMRAMSDPHTMAAWKRVGEAAVAFAATAIRETPSAE